MESFNVLVRLTLTSEFVIVSSFDGALFSLAFLNECFLISHWTCVLMSEAEGNCICAREGPVLSDPARCVGGGRSAGELGCTCCSDLWVTAGSNSRSFTGCLTWG